MNIHNKYRTIYFARSGQSLIEHSYKADSDLSSAGWEYAERLKEFVLERRAKTLEARGLNREDRRLVIWTSARRRAHHTAWPFLAPSIANMSISTMPSPGPSSGATSIASGSTNSSPSIIPTPSSPPLTMAPLPSPSLSFPTSVTMPSPSTTPAATAPLPRVKVVEKPQMSEINPGVWDGLSPDEAREKYPEEWERFLRDPYTFRAPRAESYHDLSVRLEPILIELEREQEDLLIISHASVIRCLLAYLIGLPASEIPAIEIARGDLLEVVPASYGVHSRAFHFWDGPGRRGITLDGKEVTGEGTNFYENFAEDTKYRVRSDARIGSPL